jgi:hypothetical protein
MSELNPDRSYQSSSVIIPPFTVGLLHVVSRQSFSSKSFTLFYSIFYIHDNQITSYINLSSTPVYLRAITFYSDFVWTAVSFLTWRRKERNRRVRPSHEGAGAVILRPVLSLHLPSDRDTSTSPVSWDSYFGDLFGHHLLSIHSIRPLQSHLHFPVFCRNREEGMRGLIICTPRQSRRMSFAGHVYGAKQEKWIPQFRRKTCT